MKAGCGTLLALGAMTLAILAVPLHASVPRVILIENFDSYD